MMQAWKVKKHGTIESLKLESQKALKPNVGEAVIQVQWAALNHLDLWVLKGVTGHTFPLPLIPGCDVLGKVKSFGTLLENEESALKNLGIEIGSQVLIQPILSCGMCSSCLSGNQSICKNFGLMGETKNGGAATEIQVPIKNLIALPNGVSPQKAVCLPIAYTTAYSMLFRKLKLESHEDILIQAGGSGVSVAAIQMALKRGARVTAIARGKEKCTHLKKMGVDFIIDGTKDRKEALKKVLTQIGKKGFECAIDHVGKDTFSETLRFLSWGGRLATCGATSGSAIEIDLKPVFFKNLSIHGTTMGSAADLIHLLDWVKLGNLDPVIDSEFKMTDLKKAYKKLESRNVFGKIILKNNL